MGIHVLYSVLVFLQTSSWVDGEWIKGLTNDEFDLEIKALLCGMEATANAIFRCESWPEEEKSGFGLTGRSIVVCRKKLMGFWIKDFQNHVPLYQIVIVAMVHFFVIDDLPLKHQNTIEIDQAV